MATSRPFAYNTGGSIPGTDQIGDLAIGEPTSGYFGGPQFWNGPDEELGYVIAYPQPDGLHPTPGGQNLASLGFLRSSSLTEESFINLANYVSSAIANDPQSFASGADAKNWLNTNGYWTSYFQSTALIMSLISSDYSSGSTWSDGSSHSNSATLYGGYGKAVYNGYNVLTFNGSNTYAFPAGGFGSQLNNGFTYEIWAYPKTSSNGTLLGEWQGAPPTGWTDAQLAFVSGRINSGVYSGIAITGPTFSANNWYHIVMTYDSSSQVFTQYVNGSSVGSMSGPKANPSPGTYLTLGRPDGAGAYLGGATGWFNGNIGSWRIWTGPLSATDVLNNYNDSKYKFENNLVLNFDATNSTSYSGSGSTWYDLSGKGNNGTITNAVYNAGPPKTFYFDGSMDYVSIGQPIPTGSNYSISAWVKASAVNASHNIVSSTDSPFWIANGTLYAGVGGNYTVVSSPSFPTNTWKFVSMSFNDSTNTMKLYINGSLVNTNTNVTQSYTAQNTNIGSHIYSGNPVSFWNGYISQVYIYKNEQTSSDILNLYNSTRSTYGL